jgi:predicted NUDIX family phosphoesterase
MIKTKILFNNVIGLINTDKNTVYRTYVNKKYSKRLSFNNYNHFYIDELLNIKSITLKKITHRKYVSKK